MLPQETIEWPDPIEVLIDQLENESSERDFTREERALMDIYETVPILQSDDSLHEFWQSGIDQQRIINSFELIGATSLVDPLNASRWCETRPEDRNDYSDTEANLLATIEETDDFRNWTPRGVTNELTMPLEAGKKFYRFALEDD